MIIGIGLDSVEIERFLEWEKYDKKTLQKTLNIAEIDYCLTNKAKTTERFASRFATKEAFFKAFCQAFMNDDSEVPPFLTICQNICLKNDKNGRPELEVNWQNLIIQNLKINGTAQNTYDITKNTPKVHVSVTHTKHVATVIVILEIIK